MSNINLPATSTLGITTKPQAIFTKAIKRRLTCWLFLLLIPLMASVVQAQEDLWTGIGPVGGRISKLAVDSGTATTLYAGTFDSGVLKSIDGGASWHGVNNGLTSTDILSLALDPTNANTLYTGTNDHGLFKSTDGGESWTSIRVGLPSGFLVTSIVIDPTSPLTIYAGIIGGCDFFCDGSVFKSVNGGQSWNATILTRGITALAMDPRNPTTVYAAAESNLYKTVDGGLSWSEQGDITQGFPFPDITTIAIDPISPSRLYVGSVGLVLTPSQNWIRKGIFKSNDGGTIFNEATAGLTDFNIEDLVIDPGTPATLYAATDSGVFRSGNRGKNWSELNNGLGNVFVSDLAIIPTDPPTLYAATFGSGVFVVQPVGPFPPATLRITNAFVFKKKLWVFGEMFDPGAKLLLNGELQHTRNDVHNPLATLFAKKAGNKITPGQTVTLQVRNPDGTLSQEFRFTR
ncbi:MAG: hypothetical protein WAU45_07090 [Blastocatellia bacterium]